MPIVYVSTMLGHSNQTTTSRYLNTPWLAPGDAEVRGKPNLKPARHGSDADRYSRSSLADVQDSPASTSVKTTLQLGFRCWCGSGDLNPDGIAPTSS